MIKFLHFLSQRKALNLTLGIIVYLLVTLPHEIVGITIAGIFKGVPRSQYDLTILIFSLIILLFFGIYLFLQINRLDKPRYPVAFFTLCLLCIAVSFNMLIIVNIEIIHFIQYCFLAILLFPLSKNLFTTIVLVTFLGAIDEAYQYYFLSPERTNYYDFNDVILNLLGAVMGMIFLRSHKGIRALLLDSISTFKKTWTRYFGMVLLLTLVVWQKDLVQKGINTVNLDLDWTGYGAILIRKHTTSFWTEIPPQILYHVVQPIEGLLIITTLLFIFSFLYKHAE